MFKDQNGSVSNQQPKSPLKQRENQVVNPSSGAIRLLRKHRMLGRLELQSRAHQNGQHCEAKEPLLSLVLNTWLPHLRLVECFAFCFNQYGNIPWYYVYVHMYIYFFLRMWGGFIPFDLSILVDSQKARTKLETETLPNTNWRKYTCMYNVCVRGYRQCV